MGEIGKQRGVGVASGEVARSGRYRQRPAGVSKRWSLPDAGTASRLALYNAAPAQLSERSGDGDGAKADVRGESPYGGQRLAGCERAVGYPGLDLANELSCAMRRESILF